jgi:hypothetical protein
MRELISRSGGGVVDICGEGSVCVCVGVCVSVRGGDLFHVGFSLAPTSVRIDHILMAPGLEGEEKP